MMRIVVISFLTGIYLAYSYDWLRIFRRLVRHADLVVLLEDLLFGLTGGCLIFLLLQEECQGAWRGYMVLVLLLGMSLYILALGRCVPASFVWSARALYHILYRLKLRLTGGFQKVKITVKSKLCKSDKR